MFVIITIIPLGIPIIVKCYTMFFCFNIMSLWFLHIISLSDSKLQWVWQHLNSDHSGKNTCSILVLLCLKKHHVGRTSSSWVAGAGCCHRSGTGLWPDVATGEPCWKRSRIFQDQKKPSKIKDGNDNFPWFFPLISQCSMLFPLKPPYCGDFPMAIGDFHAWEAGKHWETLYKLRENHGKIIPLNETLHRNQLYKIV